MTLYETLQPHDTAEILARSAVRFVVPLASPTLKGHDPFERLPEQRIGKIPVRDIIAGKRRDSIVAAMTNRKRTTTEICNQLGINGKTARSDFRLLRDTHQINYEVVRDGSFGMIRRGYVYWGLK